MRRRFLGGQKQQQQSSAPAAKAKGGLFRKAAASPQPPSAPGIDTTTGQVAINRRSFTAVDGPIGGGRTVAAAADYSLFLAENKYATIGGPGARSKWPLRGGTSEKALNGVGRPCPAGTGRPRSMGAAQMGVKTAETAFGAAGAFIRSGRDSSPKSPKMHIFLVVICMFCPSVSIRVCLLVRLWSPPNALLPTVANWPPIEQICHRLHRLLTQISCK